jgi:predicted dienelactone hydrolase
MREAMSATQFLARVADVKFVLDELSRRVGAGDPVVGQADLSRVGISGHSYGAVTTQALAGERFGPMSGKLLESRIRASIAFSPSGGRDAPLAGEASRFADIRQPFLSLTGTLDTSVASKETARSRQLPFERMPGPDKYLLVLDGADHGTFSGQPELRQVRRARPGAATAEADAAAYRAIRAASLMFWNAYLKDDDSARGWLLGGGLERQLGPADLWRVKR